MKVKALFPTQIAEGRLSNASGLNRALLKEIQVFSGLDKAGKAWSKTNYQGGYTSYASLNDLHRRAPVFQEFESLMQSTAEKFAKAQGWDTRGKVLTMTDLWMNIMPSGTYHTLHHHPHSVISGAYYVDVPKGSVSLKLEDPRMGFYMGAPTRKTSLYYEVKPEAGGFILFESWLRHEVPPNRSKKPRISLSFNYAIEYEVISCFSE